MPICITGNKEINKKGIEPFKYPESSGQGRNINICIVWQTLASAITKPQIRMRLAGKITFNDREIDHSFININ